MIERAVLLARGGEIGPQHLMLSAPPAVHSVPAPAPRAPEHPVAAAAPSGKEADDRQRIVDALAKSVGNQTRAAKLLGVSRATLVHKLDLYRIPRPRK